MNKIKLFKGIIPLEFKKYKYTLSKNVKERPYDHWEDFWLNYFPKLSKKDQKDFIRDLQDLNTTARPGFYTMNLIIEGKEEK